MDDQVVRLPFRAKWFSIGSDLKPVRLEGDRVRVSTGSVLVAAWRGMSGRLRVRVFIVASGGLIEVRVPRDFEELIARTISSGAWG